MQVRSNTDADIRRSDKSSSQLLAGYPSADGLTACCEREESWRDILVGYYRRRNIWAAHR
jgi:hypothetical protein